MVGLSGIGNAKSQGNSTEEETGVRVAAVGIVFAHVEPEQIVARKQFLSFQQRALTPAVAVGTDLPNRYEPALLLPKQLHPDSLGGPAPDRIQNMGADFSHRYNLLPLRCAGRIRKVPPRGQSREMVALITPAGASVPTKISLSFFSPKGDRSKRI